MNCCYLMQENQLLQVGQVKVMEAIAWVCFSSGDALTTAFYGIVKEVKQIQHVRCCYLKQEIQLKQGNQLKQVSQVKVMEAIAWVCFASGYSLTIAFYGIVREVKQIQQMNCCYLMQENQLKQVRQVKIAWISFASGDALTIAFYGIVFFLRSTPPRYCCPLNKN